MKTNFSHFNRQEKKNFAGNFEDVREKPESIYIRKMSFIKIKVELSTFKNIILFASMKAL